MELLKCTVRNDRARSMNCFANGRSEAEDENYKSKAIQISDTYDNENDGKYGPDST